VQPDTSTALPPNTPNGVAGQSLTESIGETSMKELKELVNKLQKQVEEVLEVITKMNREKQDEGRQLEERWTARAKESEERWAAKFRTLEEWVRGVQAESGSIERAVTPGHATVTEQNDLPALTITSESPLAQTSPNKRPRPVTPLPTSEATGDEDVLQDGLTDPAHASPPSKRARMESSRPALPPMEADDSLTANEPRTPSPPAASILPFKTPNPPRTPSPSHQGIIPDNSASPGIISDFFANPPPFSATGKKRKKAGPIEALPYPIFATTPKPTEPTSPTTDAPASASRGRNVAPTMLTPGRHRLEPASRAVSDAHKELSSITEADEPFVERSRVALDAPTPTCFGPELPGSTGSPPRLSASPSIGEAGFSYTLFPANPARRSVTPTPARRIRASSSPARDYMEVALHGLKNTTDSPSAQQTPGHRTMLGTERYRDTRFGDIPVFQWNTPSVDLGPVTPGQQQRDS